MATRSTKPRTFPPGWDEARIRRVLAHYEEQTEDEAVAERPGHTVIEVPRELVPTIRELLARHAAAAREPTTAR